MWRSPSQTFRSITSLTQDIIWDTWLVTKDLEAYYLSWNLKVSQSYPHGGLFHLLALLSASCGVQVWRPHTRQRSRQWDNVGVTSELTLGVFSRLGQHTCWRAEGRSPWVHVLHHQRGPDRGGSLWVTKQVHSLLPSAAQGWFSLPAWICLSVCFFCSCSACGGHHIPHVSVYPEAPYWGTPGVGVSGVQSK